MMKNGNFVQHCCDLEKVLGYSVREIDKKNDGICC